MIYFDNAATSFPKPPSVPREVDRCIRSYCGNPGRGSHTLSRRSADAIYETRERIADFFGSASPENVCFTYNDTYALNSVIKGLLHPGDHVIISDMEHNSVYRPLYRLAAERLISFDIFDSGCLDPCRTPRSVCDAIERCIRPETRLVIVSHVSNICSAALPLAEIGALCRRHGLLFVVDAAQSAGHLPIHMEHMKIDVLCAPGHKALYGIQGCGFFLLGDGISPAPFVEGGSGVNSLLGVMPDLPPERYEAGTLATPAIAALGEGIRFVSQMGLETIRARENCLFERLSEQFAAMPAVTQYAPMHEGATVLFNLDGIPSERVAEALDARGICVRSGFHCSPLGHKTLQTGPNGAVRVSFSPFNTVAQVDTLAEALNEILMS